MTNEVSNTNEKNLMLNFFSEKKNSDLAKILVGEYKFEDFKKELITLTLDDSLATCSPRSIFDCAVRVTNLGLSFNKLKKEAYIFPTQVKKKDFKGNETWVTEATVIVDYRYILDCLHKQNLVKKITLCEIYANEFESWDKLKEEIKLKENVNGVGDVIGYYCSLILNNGFEKSLYMNKGAVLEHVSRYPRAFKSFNKQTENFGVMSFHDGAKKIVLGRVLKFAPRNFEVEKIENVISEIETHNVVEDFEITKNKTEKSEIDYTDFEDI